MPLRYFGKTYQVPRNQRLAIVGDACLELLLAGEWYDTGDSPKGWSCRQCSMLSNEALGDRGSSIGIQDCIVVPSGLSPGYMTVATAMEAAIGAVFLDSGSELSRVREVALRMGLLRE